jgi:hypothetical protein
MPNNVGLTFRVGGTTLQFVINFEHLVVVFFIVAIDII